MAFAIDILDKYDLSSKANQGHLLKETKVIDVLTIQFIRRGMCDICHQ